MRFVVNQSLLAFLGLWALIRVCMYRAFDGPKSRQADQTMAFVLGYPIIVWIASFKPLAPVVAIPLALAGVAYMFAGLHLTRALAHPEKIPPHTFAGLPYLAWIALLTVGALFGYILPHA